MTEKFIVASLQDEKSKDIAEIISNDTSRKILNYLAENDASETQIASELKLPASTVNYHIKKLVNVKLIEVKNFHWSPKGNKVNVYKAARKLIVMAPKHARGFEALKGIIPAAIIGVLFLAALLAVISNIQNQPNIDKELLELGAKKFSSQDELQSFLKENVESYPYGRGALGVAYDASAGVATAGIEESTSPQTQKASAEGYSTTNIQVEGVDEADIVKNDGKYIYVVSNNKVFIVEAFPPENARIISNITINGSVQNIYIKDNKLIVFGNEYGYYGYPYPIPLAEGGVGILKAQPVGAEAAPTEVSGSGSSGSSGSAESGVAIAEPSEIGQDVAKIAIWPQIYSTSKTFVQIYNIENRESPELESNISLEGDYFNSRMIGNYLYAVVNKPIYNYDTVRPPVYIMDGITREVPANEIYYFDYPDSSYIFSTIAAINLNSGELTTKVFMMGYSQNMYVSQDNIYVIYMKSFGSRYYQDRMTELYLELVPSNVADKIKDVENSDSQYWEKSQKIGELVQEYSESLPAEERLDFQKRFEEKNQALQENIARETQKTIIQKISIDKADIRHVATGEVPGNVLNQFSMDEHEGKFRIATTTQFWFARGEESKNNLYVLDENLNIIGKLEGLAEGERIYSVRFLGERAYMVTFKQIDPLFVIDLSDANNPQVLGYLKIPGVSDYLHPYDENYVIGVGRDATDEGQIKGLKLSLFDASDPQNPKEVGKYFIGGRGTSSDAFYDHKAFLFSREKNLLVIPVTVYDEWSYKWDGAYAFTVDTEKGFTLRGTVTHQSEEFYKKNGYQDWLSTVRRSLYMQDYLYTISQRMIKASNLNSENLETVASVELPYNEEYSYPILY